MATKKISQLEAITEAEDSDVLVIVDVSEGTTNKITKGNLLLGSGHSIEMTLDPQTYQLVLKLKNAAGTELSTQTVDLPNENAITGITYNNKELIITKQVGEPVEEDLSPLIEGLVTESDFNTFTQELEQTLQGINETIGAINVKNLAQDEEIEENYKEITKLKSKVAEQEEIINQMPQAEDEGYDATLNNTIKAPFTLFSPEGHSEQDGEPSPENEVPIKSAGDNIQLLDKSYYEQGSIDGTTGQDISNAQNGRGSNYISVLPNTKYTLSCNTILLQLRLSEYGSNKSHIQRDFVANSKTLTITTTANTYYLRWSLNYGGSTVVTKDLIDSLNLKLEQGSIATPYSPYGMGSITDKIVNRNWLLNGKAFTPNAGGWYDQLGTVTISLSQINLNTNYYDLKANTNYTIKIDKYKNINAYQLAFIKNNVINAIVNTTNLANPVTFKPTENMRVWLRAQIVETNVETYFDAQLEIGSTATDYVAHEEQTYSIYTQQPFRSIGNVRDVFFKNTVDSPYYDENLILNGWYERHLPYIASYNNEVLPLDVYNEAGGIKYCNEKSMSTTGQFSLGASVQYLDESNWNCLLCTTEQTNILENIPSTFAGQTNVFSIDEVKAYLRAKGLKDLNKMFSDITNAIISLGGNV